MLQEANYGNSGSSVRCWNLTTPTISFLGFNQSSIFDFELICSLAEAETHIKPRVGFILLLFCPYPSLFLAL